MIQGKKVEKHEDRAKTSNAVEIVVYTNTVSVCVLHLCAAEISTQKIKLILGVPPLIQWSGKCCVLFFFKHLCHMLEPLS